MQPPVCVGRPVFNPTYHVEVAHAERTPRSAVAAPAPKGPKKKAFTAGAWEEARGLIWTHRKRLALGLLLMLINRLAGFVLPASTKYLMDDVVAKGHWDLLPKLAMAVGAAAIVDLVYVDDELEPRPARWRVGRIGTHGWHLQDVAGTEERRFTVADDGRPILLDEVSWPLET